MWAAPGAPELHRLPLSRRRLQRCLDCAGSSRPVRSVSIERSPFCRDSAKFRPIAMASPTDFIDVVSSASVPGNFSNVKRGIFVTT